MCQPEPELSLVAERIAPAESKRRFEGPHRVVEAADEHQRRAVGE
jgi:hypothetical protein